jgi:hypothetical protein
MAGIEVLGCWLAESVGKIAFYLLKKGPYKASSSDTRPAV